MGRDWWPSPWGADDEKGAYNRQTPAKAMEAARLIKTGQHLSAEPAARGRDPALRRPTRLPHHPRRSDGRPLRHPQPLLQRRDVQRRDRPGRLAVRRARPYRRQGGQRDPLLQRPHPGRRSAAPTACRSSASTTSARSSPAASCSTSPRSRAWIAFAINYIVTMADVTQALCAGRASASRAKATWCSSTPVTASCGRRTMPSTTRAAPAPSNTVANWLVGKEVMVVGADTWPVEAVPGEDAEPSLRVPRRSGSP